MKEKEKLGSLAGLVYAELGGGEGGSREVGVEEGRKEGSCKN